MTCRILTLQHEQEWPALAQWLQGRHNPGNGVESAVNDIISAVRQKGDDALVEYTSKFDCPDFAPPLRVSEQEIARAAASVTIESREVIGEAAANIRSFHEAQVEKSWFLTKPDGSIQDWVAIAYADTPQALWPVAQQSLLAHVERIQKLCLGR